MSDNDDPFGVRLGELIQELETEQTGDLVTEWVVVTAAAHRSDADATAYRVYTDGSVSRVLGLLRYATLQGERAVTDSFDDD